jgi:hypothetical protein
MWRIWWYKTPLVDVRLPIMKGYSWRNREPKSEKPSSVNNPETEGT